MASQDSGSKEAGAAAGEEAEYISSDDEAPLKYAADDELYDKDADEDDERFVNEHYRSLRQAPPQPRAPQGPTSTPQTSTPQNSTAQTSTTAPRPRSDAHLSCPACFDTVCVECQRHAAYATQYRAMLVMNVRVNTAEALVPRGAAAAQQDAAAQQPEGRGGVYPGASPPPPPREVLHPVVCEGCGTELGVYDQDEVYHFFNVIATS